MAPDREAIHDSAAGAAVAQRFGGQKHGGTAAMLRMLPAAQQNGFSAAGRGAKAAGIIGAVDGSSPAGWHRPGLGQPRRAKPLVAHETRAAALALQPHRTVREEGDQPRIG
jgi:hypothetical protein